MVSLVLDIQCDHACEHNYKWRGATLEKKKEARTDGNKTESTRHDS
jgi:hypothetical protein